MTREQKMSFFPPFFRVLFLYQRRFHSYSMMMRSAIWNKIVSISIAVSLKIGFIIEEIILVVAYFLRSENTSWIFILWESALR